LEDAVPGGMVKRCGGPPDWKSDQLGQNRWNYTCHHLFNTCHPAIYSCLSARIRIDFTVGFRYNGFRVMNDDLSGFLPLSPATLHILLSLAAEDLHGYGIMQEVSRQSEGRYKLGPGTLYDNLQRLMDQGVVQEVGRRSGDGDPRRRYYRL